MIVALYRNELRLNRTLFLVWAAVMIVLTFTTMVVMPTMMESSARVMGLLEAYPAEFLKGFSIDAASFSDPLAFTVVYNLLYTMLLGSIFSISVTARTLHREQAERTAEFLLVRPISRGSIFAAKVAAWLTLLVGMNLLLYSANLASLSVFTPADLAWSLGDFTVVSAYALLLMLSLGGVGLLLSAVARRARSLTGPAIGVVLGFYLLDMVAKMTDDYRAVGWASPFKWVDTAVTAPEYALEPLRVACFAALFASTTIAAALVWRRKDILI